MNSGGHNKARVCPKTPAPPPPPCRPMSNYTNPIFITVCNKNLDSKSCESVKYAFNTNNDLNATSDEAGNWFYADGHERGSQIQESIMNNTEWNKQQTSVCKFHESI